MNDAGPPHKSKRKRKENVERKGKKKGEENEMVSQYQYSDKMESDSIGLAPSPPSVPSIKCTLSSRSGKYKVVYVVENTGKQPQQGI